MKKSNDNPHPDLTTTAEIAELMASLLLSDGSLSEDAMEKIRVYLTDGKDEEEKRETMQTVLLAALRSSRALRSLPFPAAEEDVEKGWARLAQAVGLDPDIERYRRMRPSRAEEAAPSTISRPVRKFPLRRVAWRVAAAMLPIAMVAGGYFWLVRNGGTQDGTQQGPAAPDNSFVATTTMTAEPDSVRRIVLPDGTKVTLNRNASFAYNDHREGELQGEAYFEVAKDPEHPFVIHSENLKVTVLGTEFDLNTMADGMSMISLYEGKVDLEYGAGTCLLEGAGNEFTLDNSTFETAIREFDTAQHPEWLAEYETRLNIIGLGDIFDMIEVHYGVRIVNREAVDTSRRYNFTLEGAGTLESVMYALEYANGSFSYTIDGSAITLEEK